MGNVMKSMINYLNDNNSAHDLISVIDSILGACLEISLQVAQGELSGMLGSTTEQNVQGETQKKLDVISNDILKSSLLKNEFVKTLASEEEDFVVPVAENGSYVVAFDPLDGSSNIDINGQIGTIFTIYKAKVFEPAFSELQFAQQGHQQVCAGYVLYGASTLLVMSIGGPTQMFTLDRTQNEFILSDKKVDISNGLDEFSVNTSNYSQWSPQFQQYVGDLMAGSNGKRSKKFNMRWNGSMVGDVHRVLYRGGIFCYPSDVS